MKCPENRCGLKKPLASYCSRPVNERVEQQFDESVRSRIN
jgi:hypothetical protein